MKLLGKHLDVALRLKSTEHGLAAGSTIVTETNRKMSILQEHYGSFITLIINPRVISVFSCLMVSSKQLKTEIENENTFHYYNKTNNTYSNISVKNAQKYPAYLSGTRVHARRKYNITWQDRCHQKSINTVTNIEIDLDNTPKQHHPHKTTDRKATCRLGKHPTSSHATPSGHTGTSHRTTSSCCITS